MDRLDDVINKSAEHFKKDVLPEEINTDVVKDVVSDILEEDKPKQQQATNSTKESINQETKSSSKTKESKQVDFKKKTVNQELKKLKRQTHKQSRKQKGEMASQSAVHSISNYHNGGGSDDDGEKAVSTSINLFSVVKNDIKQAFELHGVKKELQKEFLSKKGKKKDVKAQESKSDINSHEDKKELLNSENFANNSTIPLDDNKVMSNTSMLDKSNVTSVKQNTSLIDKSSTADFKQNTSILDKTSSQSTQIQSQSKLTNQKGKDTGKKPTGQDKLKAKTRQNQKVKKMKDKGNSGGGGKISAITNVAQKISQLESVEDTLNNFITSKLFAVLFASSGVILLVSSIFLMGVILLFGFKSEEFELVKTYSYITELDIKASNDIKQKAKQYDEVYINGVLTKPDTFKYYSDIDSFLLFMDIKYEDYKFDSIIHGVFGGTNIKDEVKNLHEKLIHTKAETVSGKSVLNVTTDVLADVITTKDGVTKSDIKNIKDLSQFDNYIKFAGLSNPLGKETANLIIDERYAYNQETIGIQTKKEQSILAAIKGTVISVSETSVVIENKNKNVQYDSIIPSVLKGDEVTRGDVIGTSDLENNNIFQLGYKKKKKLSWKTTIPSFYFKDTERRFFTYYEKVENTTYDYEKKDPFENSEIEALVVKACEENQIKNYKDIILSIIEVENGADNDPMNVEKNVPLEKETEEPSETEKEETLTKEISIEKGVSYFAELLRIARENHLSEESSIQAYHFGEDFLKELIKNKTPFSYKICDDYATEKTSASYSRDVLEKVKTPQNNMLIEADEERLDYFKDFFKLDDEALEEVDTSFFREKGLFRKNILLAVKGDIIHISEKGGEKQSWGVITKISDTDIFYWDIKNGNQTKEIDSLEIVGFSKLY